MELEAVRSSFEELIASREPDVGSLRPSAGLEVMASFYEAARVEDCDLDADGDMLLYQWGTYDWGSGENFELDFTRQLIQSPESDPELWQLHLTFRFPPSTDLRGLSSGERWCTKPSELPDFLNFVRRSRPFVELYDHAATVTIMFEAV